MDYFKEVITSLDTNELLFLNTLYTNDSVSKFQSISKKQILSESGIKDFTFRKVVGRLEGLLLIRVVKSAKYHRYYLTNNGLRAIYQITEGANVEC